jgi:hypothetical protein
MDMHLILEISTGGNSHIINPKRKIKQLGVNADESLISIPHAKQVASKRLQALGRLCFLRHTNHGILAHIAHWHHLTFTSIPSRMLWTSPVWFLGYPGLLRPLSVTYNTMAVG